MKELAIFKKSDPLKKYKILIGLLVGILVTYGIYSACVIRDKTRFETKLDDKYYQDFVMGYVDNQYSPIALIERMSKGQTISNEEMLTITMSPPIDSQYSIYELVGFYNEYYNTKVGSNNLIYINSFFNQSNVRKDDFKRIVDNRYMLKQERLAYYENYYIKQKATALVKVIEDFSAAHKYYFDGLREKKNKHFVRDAVWQQLFAKMEDTLKQIDMEYDFGLHAPKKIMLREVDMLVLPDEVRDVNLNYADVYNQHKFKIFDTKTGVYIYFYTSECRDQLDIVRAEKSGKAIEFVIEEGKEPVYNGSPGVYKIMLIRGLKPGEAKNYSYRLTNTRGIEYTNLDK